MYNTPIHTFNLKILQTFLVVAELKSFRNAAARTYRSQSAVSAQIKRLEGELGFKLFHRTTRSVSLTQEGEKLYAGVKRAMQEVSMSLRTIQESVELGRGVVNVACSQVVASNYLPHIVSTFEQEYPNVQVKVFEVRHLDLVDIILRGEVDFGLGQKVTGIDGLSFEDIVEDRIVAIATPDLLVPYEGASLSKLAQQPLLLLSKATAFRETVNVLFHEHDLPIFEKYSCANTHTLMAMADAGLGVALIPISALPLFPLKRATVCPITGVQAFRTISVISKKGWDLTPVSERLAALATRLIREDYAMPNPRRFS